MGSNLLTFSELDAPLNARGGPRRKANPGFYFRSKNSAGPGRSAPGIWNDFRKLSRASPPPPAVHAGSNPSSRRICRAARCAGRAASHRAGVRLYDTGGQCPLSTPKPSERGSGPRDFAPQPTSSRRLHRTAPEFLRGGGAAGPSQGGAPACFHMVYRRVTTFLNRDRPPGVGNCGDGRSARERRTPAWYGRSRTAAFLSLVPRGPASPTPAAAAYSSLGPRSRTPPAAAARYSRHGERWGWQHSNRTTPAAYRRRDYAAPEGAPQTGSFNSRRAARYPAGPLAPCTAPDQVFRAPPT